MKNGPRHLKGRKGMDGNKRNPILETKIERPGVAGAVLQTPLLFNNSLINSGSDHFPPDLQTTFLLKP